MTTATRLWKKSLGSSGATPKYARIVERVAAAVGDGVLRPGDRVPSVTELADSLGVNKATVVRAFRELEQLGLLTSKVGKGSFIAEPADAESPAAPTAAPGRPKTAPPPSDELQRSIRRMRSSFADGLNQILRVPLKDGTIRLGSGVPAADSVDADVIRDAAQRAAQSPFDLLYGYAHNGLPELREEIAGWLQQRGYSVRAEGLVITNGSQEALSIVANWSRERGRTVLCETPTYIGIPLAFSHFGHVVESVTRDGRGTLASRLLAQCGGRSTTFYCCPDFHNPTGACLTSAERAEIAGAVSTSDCVVITDDLYRDLRYEGEEPKSLYEHLPLNRRVLVGSFSKSFIPGLRIGFLAADPDLLTPLAEMKRTFDLGSPTLSQVTASILLREHYADHLTRVRATYKVRRDVAIAAMEEHFPGGVEFTRPQGGFQLWVRMPLGYSSVQVYLRALARGVQINPGPAHDIDGRYPNGFRLSFSEADPDRLGRAIPILAEVLEETIAHGPEEPNATGLGLPL